VVGCWFLLGLQYGIGDPAGTSSLPPDPDGSGGRLLVPAGSSIRYWLLPIDRLALAGEAEARRRGPSQFLHQIFVGPHLHNTHLACGGRHSYLWCVFHFSDSCALPEMGRQSEIGQWALMIIFYQIAMIEYPDWDCSVYM